MSMNLSTQNRVVAPAIKSLGNRLSQNHDVSNAIKYLQDQPINDSDDSGVGESLKMVPLVAGIFGSVKGISWLWKNRKDVSGGYKTALEKSKLAKIKNPVQNYFSRIAEGVKESASKVNSGIEKLKKAAAAGEASEIAKTTEAIAKAETKTAKALKAVEKAQKAKNYKNTLKLMGSAETRVSEAKNALKALKKPGFFGKIFAPITNLSAVKAFNNSLVGRAFHRGGGVIFAAIEGAMESITEIMPAFYNKGFFSGVKQMFKSGVKMTGSIGGWIIGESAASAAGATAGAYLGSVVPVIGTGIGAVIGGIVGGIAGGMVLSSVGIKVAKSITGKSEMQKFREDQAKMQAAEVMNDPDKVNELANAVLQKAKEQQAAGVNAKDAAFAAEIAKNLSSNPFRG